MGAREPREGERVRYLQKPLWGMPRQGFATYLYTSDVGHHLRQDDGEQVILYPQFGDRMTVMDGQREEPPPTPG